MAVNLRKPGDDAPVIREITPVHICDEIYPVVNTTEPKTVLTRGTSDDVAQFLLTILQTIAKLRYGKQDDGEHPYYDDIISEFFGEGNDDIENVAVPPESKTVCYLQRRTRISRGYNAVRSNELDALQGLLECIEQEDTTFDMLCSYLDKDWHISPSCTDFFDALCDFLADIQSGNVEKLEQVLTNNSAACYTRLLTDNCNNTVSLYIFYTMYDTRLFTALYALLAREKRIAVHPLFLFACRNFGAVSEKPCEYGSDYTSLAWARAQLTAYGETLDGVLLHAPRKHCGLFEWAEFNEVSLKEISTVCALPSIGLLFKWALNAVQGIIAEDYTADLLRFFLTGDVINITLWSCLGVSAAIRIATGVLCDVYSSRNYVRKCIYRYGGLAAFLEATAKQYELPAETGKQMPRVIRKQPKIAGLLARPASVTLK